MKYMMPISLFFSLFANATSPQKSLFNYNDFPAIKELQTDFSTLFPLNPKNHSSPKPHSSNSNESILGEPLQLPKKLEIRPQKNQLFAEGTGTRGGGSGIISLISDQNPTENIYQVQLLDVYRSENLDRFSTFFSPEEGLLKISKSMVDKELASEKIFSLVLKRIQFRFPLLAEFLTDAKNQMPKNQWIAVYEEIPLIDDFIGENSLQSYQRQVQIAYRHTNKIFYNEKLYSLMDGYNKAALKLHEYLYAISSLKTSAQIQRLVSLFMGLSFTDEIDYFVAQKELKALNLEHLAAASLKLPQGTRLTEEPPTSDQLCGLIKTITLLPNSTDPDSDSISKLTNPSQYANSTLELEISYDPKNEQLQRSDFQSKNYVTLLASLKKEISDSMRSGDESQVQQLLLKAQAQWRAKETMKVQFSNPKEWIKYLFAFNYGKNYLDKKFPIYLYPAQHTPSDIVCINKNTSKISTIEISKSYHKGKNERDLKRAQAEAEYFTVLGEYIKKYASHKSIAIFRDLEKKRSFYISEMEHYSKNKQYKGSPLVKEMEEELKLFTQVTQSSIQLHRLGRQSALEDRSRSDLSWILEGEELGGLKIRFGEN